MLIAAGTLLTPTRRIGPAWLSVHDGRITSIGPGDPPGHPDHDFRPYTVAPGFVDIHVHGGGGRSFDENDAAAAEAVVAAHRDHGTTTMVASLVSAPLDELVYGLHTYRPLVEAGLLAGVHLEGPFLSEEYAGAHPAHHLRPPHPDALGRVLDAGRGVLAMITLAPELDGGMAAVRAVRAAGVVAAIGHTAATYEQAAAAIDAGATVATHLCNAMPPFHHRRPGPVPACLEDSRMAVEVIADGVHLHPATLTLLARAAGPDRLVMVSDAIAAAACGDGTYALGGQRVEVRSGRAVVAGTDVLAGSTLTLDAALRQAVAAGIDPAAAMAALTANPARVLGLVDRGRLAVGARADLVVLSEDLEVRAVMTGGELSRA